MASVVSRKTVWDWNPDTNQKTKDAIFTLMDDGRCEVEWFSEGLRREVEGIGWQKRVDDKLVSIHPSDGKEFFDLIDRQYQASSYAFVETE